MPVDVTKSVLVDAPLGVQVNVLPILLVVNVELPEPHKNDNPVIVGVKTVAFVIVKTALLLQIALAPITV